MGCNQGDNRFAWSAFACCLTAWGVRRTPCRSNSVLTMYSASSMAIFRRIGRIRFAAARSAEACLSRSNDGSGLFPTDSVSPLPECPDMPRIAFADPLCHAAGRSCRCARFVTRADAGGHHQLVQSDPADDWERLWRTAQDRPIAQLEDEYRQLITRHGVRGVDALSVAITARVMTDGRWAQHHPFAAVALAWRHRDSQGFVRSFRRVWRPRFVG
jgi:hypothetical protein